MGVKAEIIAEELIGKIIENPAVEFLPLLDTLPDVKEPFAEARLIASLLANTRPAPALVSAAPANQEVKSAQKVEKPNLKDKISAIMGGEVKEYGGGNPFK